MRLPTQALFAALAALALLLAPSASAEWKGPCVAGTGTPTCHFWKGKVVQVDDGDTLDVRLQTTTGRRKTVRVRISGVQAMEQTVYTRNPRKRRGACHAVPATTRLEQLVRAGRGTARLGAQDPSSASGGRVRRSVAVKIAGSWRDVGSILLVEGHALWLPNPVEYAWNETYDRLAQEAAAGRRNLWDDSTCGAGPGAGTALRLSVRPNAVGNDFLNVNGERVRIENLGPTPVLSLAGWWLRDSSLRRFEFPSWAAIPAGGGITVRVGRGSATVDTFYWGLRDPIFENPRADGRGMGDGAYLFDPQGDVRAWQMFPCYVSCTPLPVEDSEPLP